MMMLFDKKFDDAVSPVVGVILTVAVTVILAAVIGSFVLDLGNNLSANSQAGVTFEQGGSTVTVQAVSMGNADSLIIKAPDGTEKIINNVGDSVEVNASSGERVTVISERDGKEAVIRSFTKDATTASGDSKPGFSSPSTSAPSDISTVEFASGDGTSSNPYVIMNDQQLQAMNNDKSAHYVLGQNISASGTSSWNDGAGFNPIGGGFGNEFTGSLDGDGNVVDGLYINRSSTEYVGLIGHSTGSITNIGVVNADVSGGSDTALLAGANYGTVSDSYSSGNVSGSDGVGGLVGHNQGTTVASSYSSSFVSGSSDVGGLVGYNVGSTVESSYSTSYVIGSSNVGGLVGRNGEGTQYTDPGTVTSSYWDTQLSGQSSSDGGTGLTTSEMQGSSAESNMIGFDFTNTWSSGASGEYPALAWESE